MIDSCTGTNLVENPALVFSAGANTLLGNIFAYTNGSIGTIQVDGTSLDVPGTITNISESNTAGGYAVEFREPGIVNISGFIEDGVVDDDPPNGVFAQTGIRKLGAGTMTLSGGLKNYSGWTFIIEGSLVLDNPLVTSSIPNTSRIAMGPDGDARCHRPAQQHACAQCRSAV